MRALRRCFVVRWSGWVCGVVRLLRRPFFPPLVLVDLVRKMAGQAPWPAAAEAGLQHLARCAHCQAESGAWDGEGQVLIASEDEIVVPTGMV